MEQVSYIIYIESGIVKALNGTTGMVDFSGTNAATVIQMSIDSLIGGIIFIKKGIYNITKNLTIHQGIIIEGEGEQSTILSLIYNNNFNGLTLTGGTKWTILRDLEIYGNAPVSPIYSTDGIVISGSMVELNNLYIRNCARHGINANNFVHLRMINVYSGFNRTGSGAYLHREIIKNDSCNQIYIEGGNYVANDLFGIGLKNTSNTLLEMVNFGQNDQDGGDSGGGLSIIGGSNITVENCYFEGQPYNIYIRNSNLGIGRNTDANELRIINSMFNPSTICDIDGTGITGIKISQCFGNKIRLSAKEIDYENSAFKTEDITGTFFKNNVLSNTFSIDSAGLKTVTIPHGLAIAPKIQDCQLTVVQNTAVDDWAYNLLKVTYTDATNVTTKINVSIASTTMGATAKLALRVGNY